MSVLEAARVRAERRDAAIARLHSEIGRPDRAGGARATRAEALRASSESGAPSSLRRRISRRQASHSKAVVDALPRRALASAARHRRRWTRAHRLPSWRRTAATALDVASPYAATAAVLGRRHTMNFGAPPGSIALRRGLGTPR